MSLILSVLKQTFNLFSLIFCNV